VLAAAPGETTTNWEEMATNLRMRTEAKKPRKKEKEVSR
jgi:hypothetical protein